MSRNVSSAFHAAVNSETTDEIFLILITISHPSFADDIRICNDTATVLPIAGVRGVISRGNEYIYLPFQITLPTQDETGIGKAQLSIDNVDRAIVAAMRSANSVVSVKIEIALSSDPDTIEASLENFRLESVKYDAMSVSGTISIDYFELEPFPKGRFVPSHFPGMF